jgi:tripartite-type tricarboxylate transporter receptor subunit TctC
VIRHVVLALAGLLLTQQSLAAQDWPARPIHVVIPFGAGSATDIVPRIVFDRLSPQLGQSIVVENRAGAGGTIGTAAVAKAEPDGYTLLAHSNAFSVAPAIYSKLPYDTLNDFAPVMPFGSLAVALVIAPSKGFKTIQEMVAAAKAKPGSFTFASVGVGSGTHLSSEKMKFAAGFDAVHVPFRGGPEALTEVVAGRVDFYFCPVGTALPFIRDGRLVALVVNGASRDPELPDVPTTREVGYANAEFPIWIGMLAPAKTPQAIVGKLNAEIAKAVMVREVKDKLAKAGVTPDIMTPEAFAVQIEREVSDNLAVAKAAGIKPN